jgi:hypothetical protein
MGTKTPPVSCAFAHPFPALNVVAGLDAVKVGTASVGMVPVGVYVGRSDAGPALLIVAGGQTSAAVAEGAREPAPAPPVCHAARGPVQGLLFLHAPAAERGSVGIQPCCSPSW